MKKTNARNVKNSVQSLILFKMSAYLFLFSVWYMLYGVWICCCDQTKIQTHTHTHTIAFEIFIFCLKWFIKSLAHQNHSEHLFVLSIPQIQPFRMIIETKRCSLTYVQCVAKEWPLTNACLEIGHSFNI